MPQLYSAPELNLSLRSFLTSLTAGIYFGLIRAILSRSTDQLFSGQAFCAAAVPGAQARGRFQAQGARARSRFPALHRSAMPAEGSQAGIIPAEPGSCLQVLLTSNNRPLNTFFSPPLPFYPPLSTRASPAGQRAVLTQLSTPEEEALHCTGNWWDFLKDIFTRGKQTHPSSESDHQSGSWCLQKFQTYCVIQL